MVQNGRLSVLGNCAHAGIFRIVALAKHMLSGILDVVATFFFVFQDDVRHYKSGFIKEHIDL